MDDAGSSRLDHQQKAEEETVAVVLEPLQRMKPVIRGVLKHTRTTSSLHSLVMKEATNKLGINSHLSKSKTIAGEFALYQDVSGETIVELNRHLPNETTPKISEMECHNLSLDPSDFVIQLIQNSPAACIITDLEGNILIMNNAFKQMFRVHDSFNPAKDKQEVGHINRFIPREYRSKHEHYLAGFRKKPATERKVKRVTLGLTWHGEKIPLKAVISSSILPSNQQECFIVYMKDLSLEFKTKTLEEMYENVIGMSSIPMVGMDENCLIRMFNKAAEEVWMVTKDTVLNTDVKCLMPANLGNIHGELVQSYLKGIKERGVIGKVRTVVGKRLGNGSEFPLEIKVAEVVHEINQKRSFVAFLRDLTAVMTAKEFQMTLYPSAVVERLSNGIAIHDYHPSVSILFCDM